MSLWAEAMRNGRLLWTAAAILVAILALLPSPAANADDAKAAAFRQSAAEVRRAMAGRDLEQAADHLKAASQSATTQAQQDEVDRLRSLLDYLGQFWKLLDAGAAKFQPGDELMVGGKRVSVVEADGGEIVLKVEGQLRRYSKKTMPTSLAMALAEKTLAKDAVSKVVVGTFLAMDAKGDRKAALRLWKDAVRGGLDVEYLLAELDSPGGGKMAVPTDEMKIKAAQSAIQQEYKHLYTRVGITVWRDELIRRWLAAAPKLDDDPVRRFVMLRDARDMAAAAGDLREAEKAIELLARYYEIDAIEMRLGVLGKLAKSARGMNAARETVLQAFELAEQAFKQGRLKDAEKATEIAVEAARKTKNRLLMQQAAMAQREIEQRLRSKTPRKR